MNQIKNIDSPELKGLLSIKILSALEYGITVHIEIPDKIDRLSINIIDLIRIIGILLDNAIDECRKKIGMKMQFAIFYVNNITRVLVVNELTDDKLDTSKIFEMNYTTKDKGQGIGLYELQLIISKYDNIYLKSHIEANNFTQELNITT